MNSNNYVNKENLHVVTIKDREMLTVTGVIDVINFDENLVEASTACGDITIDGEGLKISVVDIEKGELTLTGKIFGFYYNEKKVKKNQGLFGKKS